MAICTSASNQPFIKVWVASLENLTEDSAWVTYAKKHSASEYLSWKDKLRSVVGSIMSEQLLQEVGLSDKDIKTIARNAYGRPYLPQHPFDFNVSHCKDFVVAVCASKKHIGVDVEFNRDIPISSYRDIFHPKEWNILMDTDISFFELWTKKESLLKAKGSGFQEDVASVCVFHSRPFTQDAEFVAHFYPIDIPNYTCYVCSSFPCALVEVKPWQPDEVPVSFFGKK